MQPSSLTRKLRFLSPRYFAAAFLLCATAALAHPYASLITNFSAGGTNFVSFYLNEGATTVIAGNTTNTNTVSVSVTTFPSGTTTVLSSNASAGQMTFALGADTKYSISVTKLGSGAPFQISADTGFEVWNGGATIRAVDANKSAQFGDSFGRVYVGLTGSTTTDSQTNVPVRGWGIYGLTPDLQANAFFGGVNPTPICTVYQIDTLTFKSAPTNGNTFAMDGVTITWTTNAVTNTATQVAVTNSAAASATNLATAISGIASTLPGNLTVSVSNTVVSLTCFAQNISAEPYYTFATAGATGPFANDFLTGDAGFGAGPWRIFCSPDDGLVWVADATDGNANIYNFGRDFESTNSVFSVTGRIAGEGVLEHGNINGMAIRGSLAKGNLQFFTADNDMAVPLYLNNTNLGILGNGGIGNFGAAQETVVGDANEIYRYDVGSHPFPITNTPVFAATLGLDGGFADTQQIDVTLGPDTNFIYATFRRANYSDGNLQVFRADTGARVYTSLSGTPSAPNDVFGVAGILPIPGPTANTVQGDYAGLRISPDGRFIATMTIANRIVVANLTNGIPDESTAIVITNLSSAGNGRGIAWDAADNLYTASSGQALLRSFSLGISTTCVTSNDLTGTNGSFQVILPNASASVVNNGDASQNYGSPTAGHFSVNLGVRTLDNPVIVNFSLGGTATNGVNYNIVTGSIGNGITVSTNTNNTGTVSFPAGTFPGSGNWIADVAVSPTASPAVGPTLVANLTLLGGSTYIAATPVSANVNIFNTGAQFFFISPSPTATTMSRAITNDYAEFIINRWGDVNGPGNSAGSVTPKNVTLTTFTYAGTASFPADFTAGTQPFTGSTPADGSFNVTFAPGVSSLIVMIGNPVSHGNVLAPPTNATIFPALTNSATGTNQTSQEGFAYTVGTSTTPITLFDNAEGTSGEVVLWSDPLTNSSGAGSNYTVTFASTNLGPVTQLPVVIPNYTSTNGGSPNGSAANFPANSNDFDVQLGFPIASESAFETTNGVGFFAPPYAPPLSPVMVANGWNSALRMTVNKQAGSAPTMSGVNFFPTTNVFNGNYALRFDMYLSIWSDALNNHAPLNFPRQFAAFGVDTQGTNTDWRLSTSVIPTNSGSGPTNADGIWWAIDAADQSLTPADFDGFVSPALPNAGTSDFTSTTANTEAGVFKRPPFPNTDGAGAGTPINQWVSVSVETKAQTNVTLIIDSSQILNEGVTNIGTLAPVTSTNVPGNWTNGLPMLGYLQPYPAQSDESAFVYYSNVRVVELSPYITQQPLSALVLAGSNLTLTSTATYAQPGITNIWFTGVSNAVTPIATNTTVASNMIGSLTLNNITSGTNYFALFADRAGSVTSFQASVEVITPPAGVTANAGGNANFTITSSGTAGISGAIGGVQSAPKFQWLTNGVIVPNNSKFAGTTTATLTVSNVTAADALLSYTCIVTNIATNLNGNNSDLYILGVAQSVTTAPIPLTLFSQPIVSPAAQTNAWGSSATFTVSSPGTGPFHYGWQKSGALLAGATKYAGTNTDTLTISNLTTADAGSYTAVVSNSTGVGPSTAGLLAVFVPPPTFSPIAKIAGGNISFSFTSTNSFDNTNAFTLQSAGAVTGPFATVTNAVITVNAGVFSVSAPQPTNTTFFRLKHSN